MVISAIESDELRQAIIDKRLEFVRHIVSNVLGDRGIGYAPDIMSYIEAASDNRRYDVVELLLNHGRFDKAIPKLVDDAIRRGRSDTLIRIVTDGYTIDVGQVLWYAVKNKQEDLALLLLDDPDIDYDDVLVGSASADLSKVVKVLIDRGHRIKYRQQRSTLRDVCSDGHIDTLRILVDSGVDINVHIDGLLKRAIVSERHELIEYLLDIGDNIPRLNSKYIGQMIINDKAVDTMDSKYFGKLVTVKGRIFLRYLPIVELFVKRGFWHDSLNPYTYLPILDEHHVRFLGRYHDVVKIIKGRDDRLRRSMDSKKYCDIIINH